MLMSRKGQKSLPSESGRDKGHKPFVGTTRIDLEKMEAPLVDCDWSTFCQTLYDGVDRQAWKVHAQYLAGSCEEGRQREMGWRSVPSTTYVKRQVTNRAQDGKSCAWCGRRCQLMLCGFAEQRAGRRTLHWKTKKKAHRVCRMSLSQE